MRPSAHIVTSGIVGVFVGIHFQSLPCAIMTLVSGVVIDADHFLDYYITHGFTFNIKNVYNACLKVNLKTLILILHSYELIALLWVCIYIFSLSPMWKAMAVGVTQHMIFDQLVNPINKYGYFLTYRIAKGFRKELLLKRYRRVAV